MDKTTKKMAAEMLGAQRERPVLTEANKAMFRAAAELQQAWNVWNLVDRNNDNLNAAIDTIREKYELSKQ